MVAAGDDRVSDEELEKMAAAACPTCGSCSGMFTANSMNCLNEAIGLALPGNGTVLATHQLRWSLFERAGERIVEMAQAYYRGKDSSVLPRSIATFEAFENAMSLDIAMGGSTNTVLHLLAMAREAGVDFTMADIDRLSRQVPCICKVAPASQEFHVEDVARAGGIPTILGELQRAGLVHAGTRTVAGGTMGDLLAAEDLRGLSPSEEARKRALAAPGGCARRRPSPRPITTRRRTWTTGRAASVRWSTPIRGTAAWPSSSATSPRTAGSSRPPASTSPF